MPNKRTTERDPMLRRRAAFQGCAVLLKWFGTLAIACPGLFCSVALADTLYETLKGVKSFSVEVLCSGSQSAPLLTNGLAASAELEARKAGLVVVDYVEDG